LKGQKRKGYWGATCSKCSIEQHKPGKEGGAGFNTANPAWIKDVLGGPHPCGPALVKEDVFKNKRALEGLLWRGNFTKVCEAVSKQFQSENLLCNRYAVLCRTKRPFRENGCTGGIRRD
jgi:hypothetical protein